MDMGPIAGFGDGAVMVNRHGLALGLRDEIQLRKDRVGGFAHKFGVAAELGRDAGAVDTDGLDMASGDCAKFLTAAKQQTDSAEHSALPDAIDERAQPAPQFHVSRENDESHLMVGIHFEQDFAVGKASGSGRQVRHLDRKSWNRTETKAHDGYICLPRQSSSGMAPARHACYLGAAFGPIPTCRSIR